VSDLVVEDNDLVIGTHGRSMWVMDGIGVLRQITPEKARAALAVLTPRGALRRVPGRGATIEYLLREAADRVTVEILDTSGNVIRTATGSADEDKRPVAEANFSGPAGARPPSRKAGLNRFVWDLRYPGAEGFDGMILWSARPDLGPLAPPGLYRARVTAAGATETVEIRVDLDPRLTSVTVADVRDQFELAMKINDATSLAHGTVKRIRDIRRQVMEAERKAKDRRVSADVAALMAKLSAVEEELYQTKNRSGQDPLNFPIKLGNKLASLRRSLETGDGAPSPGAREVFGLQKTRLDSILARYETAIRVDLAALNKRLAAKKLGEVQVALPPKTPRGD
jgi:hypothetical protein